MLLNKRDIKNIIFLFYKIYNIKKEKGGKILWMKKLKNREGNVL